jgi:hypothetical protein
MLVYAEDLAVVDANAFEDAVAIEKAVVINADLGIRFVVELAVDVDSGCHRGASFRWMAKNWYP